MFIFCKRALSKLSKMLQKCFKIPAMIYQLFMYMQMKEIPHEFDVYI